MTILRFKKEIKTEIWSDKNEIIQALLKDGWEITNIKGYRYLAQIELTKKI